MRFQHLWCTAFPIFSNVHGRLNGVHPRPPTTNTGNGGVGNRQLLEQDATSWTTLKASIAGAGTQVAVTLSPWFISDYDSQIRITESRTVEVFGNGVVADGNGANNGGGFFDVTRGSMLILHNLTLQNANGNANSNFGGGAINVGDTTGGASLALRHCKVLSNSASNGDGGAIYSSSASTIHIESSLFQGNNAWRWSANARGGAMYCSGEVSCAITTSFFIDNYVKNRGSNKARGGGIYFSGGTLRVVQCEFKRNKAEVAASNGGEGGAIYLQSTALAVYSSSFNLNVAVNSVRIYSKTALIQLYSQCLLFLPPGWRSQRWWGSAHRGRNLHFPQLQRHGKLTS
jgi:predicted outer membrane repeat protein